MVERFQQQQLQSAQVGIPKEDNAASTASAIIAKTANAQREAVLQQAAQQFTQAQQSFSDMNKQSLILANAMETARTAERKVLLAQDVANKQHTLSMRLRDWERATKLEYAADSNAGVEAFQQGAKELAAEFMPKKGKLAVVGEYAKAFNTEITQASERMYSWQGQQERETINAAIKENQKQFGLAVGQEADPDAAIDKFLKFSSYLHTSAPRMSPAQHLESQDTIRNGLMSFVKTVAKQNPARIEDAITIAKGLVPGAPTPDGQLQRWSNPAINEEQAEEARDTARTTTKRLLTEAVDKEKNINERRENELENGTTVLVQNAIAKRDIRNPNASQIDALKNAAAELGKNLPAIQSEFTEVNNKLKSDPQNLVLLARQGSLNKQIKLLETQQTKLDNAADSVARTIDVRNQMAIQKAHAQAARAQAAATHELAAETKAAREQQKADEAATNVEIAMLSKRGTSSTDVAAKASELSAKLPTLVKKMEETKAALEKDPKNPKLQAELQGVRQEVNFTAGKVVKLNTHAEVMQNREIHKEELEEKSKAKSRLEIMKTATVTGDVKAGLEARVAMPWVSMKKGKFELTGVANYGEAQANLRALEEGITDAYKAGILTSSERDSLSARNQKSMQELQQVDKPWVEFQPFWAPLTAAINKPLNDYERKGILPPPGTPQYKAFVGKIEEKTTKALNGIYESEKIANPAQYVRDNGAKIAGAVMQEALEGSR